ncbi:IclR family transcriptional regulator [Streptomyces radicis]|uniref:IclR family transcriptional regulator n=1 Tax=Streptomyces radicis TaxID=1750517 RepID=A0A3A9VXG1_9ACTN|nr:IclR family transcriptional regulator [Streptomyces radicis]RKN05192.1 IclR family transcriptional regulator [Streptomyces radicis]RKN16725.1 IclR family transcriptional regulator [Streptomyces radicis]
MSNNGPGVTSSVDNALRLLELIGERQALRVSDAAVELGVAPSTAHRLLNALRRRGFVLQEKPNGAYRPGPVLGEIGLAAIGRVDIRQVARPVIEDVRDRTQETVSLSLLEGRNVRFIDCVESPRAVRVGDRTGVVMPAHCTAAGKAILAAMPEAELSRRFAGHELATRTENSVTDWPALEAELDEVRRLGYAVNMEEGERGISAVAAVLRDRAETPLASIAVVVPALRLTVRADARKLADDLLAARDALQDRLRQG